MEVKAEMLIDGTVVDNSIIPIIDLSTFQGVVTDMEDNRFPFNVVHCADSADKHIKSITIADYVQTSTTPFIVQFINGYNNDMSPAWLKVNNDGTAYPLVDKTYNSIHTLNKNVLYVIRYDTDSDDKSYYQILGIIQGIAGLDIYGSGVVPNFDEYDFENYGIVGSAASPIEINDIGRITHQVGNGYNHIPSNGSNNQILTYKAAGTAQWKNIDDIIDTKLRTSFKIGEDFDTFEECQSYIAKNNLYGCTVYLSVKDIPETGISVSGGLITCLDFGFNNNDLNKYDESWENTDVFAITASGCTIKNLLFNCIKSENPYKYIKLKQNCKIDNVIINKTDDAGSGKTYSIEGSGIIECSGGVGTINITNCILQNVNINITDTYQLNPNNGYFFVSNNVINKLTVNTGSKQIVGNPLVCVVNNIFGEEPSITTALSWGKQFINNNTVIS